MVRSRGVMCARSSRVAVALGVLAVGALGVMGPAHAGANSSYGTWSVSDGRGEMRVPLAGFPEAAVTTDSSSVAVGSGKSAFLASDTPVGAMYGSSRGEPYVNLRTASGGKTSTTTLTFAHPPSAGTWAFTLGDIDADLVEISATDVNGKAVTAEQLGWKGAFNYCQGSPRPSTCSGTGPWTDLPTWDAATMTLAGNGPDTSGAAGWFEPTVPLSSLTVKFSRQVGIPIYQLWVSSLDARVGGRLTSDCGTPEEVKVALYHPDGTPVTSPSGQPVTTTSHSSGAYSFGRLAPSTYKVVPIAGGYDPASATADTTDARDATDVNLRLTCEVIEVPGVEVVVASPYRPTIIPAPPGNDDLKVVRPPDHGKVQVEGNELIYTPGDGCGHHDSFAYSSRNPRGQTEVRAVDLHVQCELPQTGAVGLPGLAGSALALALSGCALFLLGRRGSRMR